MKDQAWNVFPIFCKHRIRVTFWFRVWYALTHFETLPGYWRCAHPDNDGHHCAQDVCPIFDRMIAAMQKAGII